MAEKTAKLGLKVAGDFTELADKPNSSECAEIARKLAKQYVAGELDKVEMIYHHFKSAGSQILTRKTFLPIDLSTEAIGEDNDRDLTKQPEIIEAVKRVEERKEQEAEAKREE